MASFAGIILRSADKEITAKFYEMLGLNLQEHDHGGPHHFGCTDTDNDCLLEVYDKSDNYSRDVVMIKVDSIKSVLDKLSEISVEIHHPLKKTGKYLFTYVRDPDNRDIMLLEDTE